MEKNILAPKIWHKVINKLNKAKLDYLLVGGSIDIVFQLLSAGGIIGLLFGGFLVAFTPPVILLVLAGIFQLFWSYFLSCLFIFLVKKLS